MATATWAHTGGDFATANFSMFSGASGSGTSTPDFVTAGATWAATDDENGTSGTLNFTADGGMASFANFAILVQLVDDSSIDPAETVNTIRIAFDYNVTNGPMGTGVAKSDFNTGLDAPVTTDAGTSSGTIDQSVDGVTFGIPTIGDLFFFWGSVGGIAATGFNWTCYTDSGTFSAHDRALTISNFIVEVDYGAVAPVVTDVTPTHGDKAGGTVVTLTGTGFTGATSALFGATAVLFTPSSDTSGTCVSPAHAVGQVTVTVA
jgi:hypothetical protein